MVALKYLMDEEDTNVILYYYKQLSGLDEPSRAAVLHALILRNALQEIAGALQDAGEDIAGIKTAIDSGVDNIASLLPG